MGKFTSVESKLKVNETMASLLCPLKNHCDEETKECIDITLRILQSIEVADDEEEQNEI